VRGNTGEQAHPVRADRPAVAVRRLLARIRIAETRRHRRGRRGRTSARLHRLITQNGAARSVKLVTGSVAMAKSGLAVARSQLLYQ